MTTVADIGEAGLLARIARAFGKRDPRLLVGVGDDAAVLRALGPTAVVSADMLVEDVDFSRVWAKPEDIGHKAAAANLSDLAAMGATPRALVVALAMQPREQVSFVLRLLRSLDATGRGFGAPLVGGDISKTAGPLIVSVTVLGVASQRHVLQRHQGRLGDVVMVSGTLGGAALGLRALQARSHEQCPCADASYGRHHGSPWASPLGGVAACTLVPIFPMALPRMCCIWWPHRLGWRWRVNGCPSLEASKSCAAPMRSI